MSAGPVLEADGRWGCSTTAALQSLFGLDVDGIVWHQWPSNAQPAFASGWQYDRTGKGSAVIRAMQGSLGVNVDGLVGPQMIMAMQRRYGLEPDGELPDGSECVREMQRRLNEGAF